MSSKTATDAPLGQVTAEYTERVPQTLWLVLTRLVARFGATCNTRPNQNDSGMLQPSCFLIGSRSST